MGNTAHLEEVIFLTSHLYSFLRSWGGEREREGIIITMASGEKILKSADLAYETGLDLFQIPVSNLGVSDVKYIVYKPTNMFSTEGNVKFRVPGAGSAYIDMQDIVVRTLVRITRADGSLIPARPSGTPSQPKAPAGPQSGASSTSMDEGEWSISPVNNLADSLWHQIEVRMNDSVVLGGMTGYCYASMLNILLDEKQVSDEELQCAMFYKDTGGYVSSLSIATGGNEGHKKRYELMKESRSVEVQAKLDADVFKTTNYLINGVTLDITLFPTSSDFRLLTGNNKMKDYVLEIQDISLIVKQIVPAAQVLVAHQQILRSDLSRAKYFYLKEDIRKFTLARGIGTFFVEDGYNGKIPSTLAIAFVAGDSLTGRIDANPYNFSTYDLTSINVSLSGCPTPRGPLTFDFGSGKYLQSYADLYADKSKRPTHSQRITLEEFPNGYSLFVVHLNPQNRDTYYPTSRDGSVRIELRFGTQLPHSVVMITRVKYPCHYELDYQRNVFLS